MEKEMGETCKRNAQIRKDRGKGQRKAEPEIEMEDEGLQWETGPVSRYPRSPLCLATRTHRQSQRC